MSPTTFRNDTDPTPPAVAAAAPITTVLVRVSYELEVPVPDQYQGSPDTAETWAEDHLARLPDSEQAPYYVEDSERTTYTAQAAR